MSSAKQNGFAGRPVQVLVIGAGARGEIYSRYALAHPDLMQVVAVAEPRDIYRQQFVEQHGISADKVFTDWQQAADAGKLADAADLHPGHPAPGTGVGLCQTGLCHAVGKTAFAGSQRVSHHR